MLNKPSVRVINFDDSVTAQEGLFAKYPAEVLDLKYMGPKTRFWYGPREKEEVARRIRSSNKNSVTFLGSGDFHHISALLIGEFEEPISVIDFDLHPDWCAISPWTNCGSWVSDILEYRNVLKCVLLGVASSEISNLALYTANLNSLKADRVEVYPYSHNHSIVYFRKVPRNISVKIEKGLFSTRICWSGLRDKNLREFLLHILRRLPSNKVYLTIDKDCLKRDHALTNWEEGRLSLDELLVMLKLVKDNTDIVGADISGDYSDISVAGNIKKIVSCLDHPKDFSAKGVPASRIRKVNEDTNIRILELLTS